MFRYAKYRSFLKIDLICYFFNSLVTAHKYTQKCLYLKRTKRNNAKMSLEIVCYNQVAFVHIIIDVINQATFQ